MAYLPIWWQYANKVECMEILPVAFSRSWYIKACSQTKLSFLCSHHIATAGSYSCHLEKDMNNMVTKSAEVVSYSW